LTAGLNPWPFATAGGRREIPAKHARIIRGLIAIREAVRDVLRAQAEDEPWGGAQNRQRSAYASFVQSFGPINLTTISEMTNADRETRETFRRPNLQPFLDDPDVWLVASIEEYDLDSGTAPQGPIFRDRVLHPETTPLIERGEDALAVPCTKPARSISTASPNFWAAPATPRSPNWGIGSS
jgi:N12 class adenine-specific DNA methylase